MLLSSPIHQVASPQPLHGWILLAITLTVLAGTMMSATWPRPTSPCLSGQVLQHQRCLSRYFIVAFDTAARLHVVRTCLQVAMTTVTTQDLAERFCRIAPKTKPLAFVLRNAVALDSGGCVACLWPILQPCTRPCMVHAWSDFDVHALNAGAVMDAGFPPVR